jgi:GT2 family glycosyltransferase
MTTKYSFDLTIAIVSYNTKDLLERCLTSIYQHSRGIKIEVIVVDNASTDGSAALVKKKFPQVKLIKNKTNRFYTGAINQALAIARGRYFLILNSDIFLKENSFKKLVKFMDKKLRVGATEPLQVDEAGKAVSTGSRHNQPLLDFYELTWPGRLFKNQAQLDRFRLKKRDRSKIWSAEVICDACLIIQTELFRKIGGYDERLKLYYTENDLCQMIQKHKYQTVHQGKIKVWHTVSASTNKTGWQKISDIYASDAFHYYWKHGERLSGLLLYLSLKLNNLLVLIKKNLFLFSTLVLASWLRFFRLTDWMIFIGDQGHDYLSARDLILSGKLPLVGIDSSVPWLKQGPIFVWLTALCLKLGRFQPVAPAFLTAFLGVFTVYLIYELTQKWFSKSTAQLSALIMAVSPLVIAHDRMPYHTSPIPFFACLYLLSLIKLEQKKMSLFWPVLVFSLLFQFELTTAPMFILIPLVYWWQKRRPKRKDLGKGLLGLVLPFLPKLVYDLHHGFTQTLGFAAWLGYRFLSFFGYSGRHTISLASLRTVTLTIIEFWTKFVSWNHSSLAWILGLMVLAVLAFKLKFLPRLLLASLVLNLAAFYLHQAPSEAYFPVLFPVWTILLAWAFQALATRLRLSRLALVLVIGLLVVNLYFLLTSQLGSLNYGPNLSKRLAVVDLIIKQTQNQDFKLKNPPEPGLPAAYLDNYRYLLWYRHHPESTQANLTYSIDDQPSPEFIQPANTTVYHFPNQKLIRYD